MQLFTGTIAIAPDIPNGLDGDVGEFAIGGQICLETRDSFEERRLTLSEDLDHGVTMVKSRHVRDFTLTGSLAGLTDDSISEGGFRTCFSLRSLINRLISLSLKSLTPPTVRFAFRSPRRSSFRTWSELRASSRATSLTVKNRDDMVHEPPSRRTMTQGASDVDRQDGSGFDPLRLWRV